MQGRDGGGWEARIEDTQHHKDDLILEWNHTNITEMGNLSGAFFSPDRIVLAISTTPWHRLAVE